MLSFLSPVFLAGAAAVAIPLVLHLLKREPEPRVKFAAVRLLKHAPVEHTEKRHLRELLLLALRIATLVLLALAFARPFFASGNAGASDTVTVVALDISYSLAAPGQFERAKRLAKEAIASAPAGELVGVVTFADESDIVVRATADRVLAAAAVDQATPGYGATRYRAALSAASQALDGHAGTIVVVTDLQESGWDAGDGAVVADDAKITVVDVGAPPPNVAVTAIRPEPDRVTATVYNAGAQPRDTRVHLSVDGRPAGEATASLGAHQSADVVFAAPARGKAAAVSVDDAGGIQADNTRYAVLSGTRVPSVLIVTGSGDVSRDAFYVQQALAVGGARGAAYEAIGTTGTQLSTVTGDRLAAHAAVMLLSTRGLERRGREALASFARGGGGLFIAAGPDVDGEVVRDVLGDGSTLRVVSQTQPRPEPRVVAPADARHPVLRAFAENSATLGLVKFRNAARIGGSACQTLARFTTGETALIECPAGEGRAIVLASDVDNRWNDFPLHATFVPFLHEVVRYVSGARAHASEYLVADAPAGVQRVPGIATVDDHQQGRAPRAIAINVDPREADAARLSVEEFQSAVTRAKRADTSPARVEARQREDRQHLWQYVLAFMVMTLAVEGVVAGRTR